MKSPTSSIPFKIEKHPSPLSDEEREHILKNPGFGQFFTDHMVIIKWTKDKGWHNAVISQYKSLEINPASTVLHYGQEIFEGLKAYRAKDGRILLFRPDANAQRFIESARRLAMPELPKDIFLDAVHKLVRIDQKWISGNPNASLYIRPFMFGNENFLGVRPSEKYIFCIIASPVESYFKGEEKPVSVWLETDYSRAGPGGTGVAKCGGNYAASLLAQKNAEQNNCSQVLFLDMIEHKWIEELGGMNVCFIMENNTLVTPALNGTILAGITRHSILKLAQKMGLKIEERPYSFESLQEDARSNHLKEVFACGTAAVVTSIGRFKYKGGEFVIGNGMIGEVTKKLRTQLVDLQKGNREDKNGWVHSVQLS
ncbi:branched chain amino acid aminotransferase [Bartonella henselae]|uniref:Probable branched-chain-amino-acid aminotransferase n=2 Tax=Bartonella TaxID=773 RepID=X5MHM6_BARHN|nr:branched-chain amino acid aminotransferase [Bartonella henselae]MDM9997023.1 branched-chain amino acid aminotransferase [Bartonella henselae]OLL48667.1 branched chain amino acid aminotransferase [Bartonella henselae]OLL51480.1 branched chain amino acid aminotransferase [Bartonella henselae]OLL51915.1 branched chain amino acid aminotransferase [Bartonella henselae]OLL54598.1 branched chain amino acid aminotransferase [Bartonella henselae]